MTNPILFLLSAAALLFAPGPTNTLLLTSGAAAGWRGSLGLVLVEGLGYASALAILSLGVGPLMHAVPAAAPVLKIAASLNLLWLAVRLWSRGGDVEQHNRRVEPPRLYLTTLLNPKALVFAFIIVPHLFDGRWNLAIPYLAALGALIMTAGTAWVIAGAMAGPSVARIGGGGAAQRVGAVAQVTFAGILIASVIW